MKKSDGDETERESSKVALAGGETKLAGEDLPPFPIGVALSMTTSSLQFALDCIIHIRHHAARYTVNILQHSDTEHIT
jgi:hypothetical protein